MPQIVVVTDSPTETTGKVVYRERISSADLESAHFSGQLVERVSWAVRDANKLEHGSNGRPLRLVRGSDLSAAG